jgi:serine/threonine-protein kinase
VHRDVKPENILLSDEGIVKVADFGLARAVESDPTATRTGLMMGTVAYCAPEQISRGSTDPRSDVYSAGIVLFELLTGAPPYRGDSAMNVAWQHVHSRVPAPSSRVKGIPTEIDELVVTVTDSDPEIRPADAAAFLAELADVRAELDLPVTPVPARARTRERIYERPRTPDAETTDELRRGVGGQHDTVLVDRPAERRGAGAATGRLDPPPPVVVTPEQAKAERKSRRRRRALIASIVVVLLALGAAWGGKLLADHFLKYVPNVTRQPEAAAIHRLEDAGYHVPRTKIFLAFDTSVPAGAVIRTDPKAGKRYAAGGDVSIFVSRGPQKFLVPRVRGSDITTAIKALQRAGLENVAAAPRQRYDDTVPKGEVIGTDPAAGQRVPAATTITVITSLGPPIVAVPDIPAGTPLADAKSTLRHSAGKFGVQVVEEYSDSIGEGEVISLQPNDRAVKGSTITVTVSKGPEMVSVPDISMGEPVAEAEQALRDAHLVPDVRPFGGLGKPVSVLAISPSAGTRVHSGSTVVVYALTA